MAAPVRVNQQPQVALAAPTKKKRRWSTGHVVMIIAGLLGAALTLLALRAADARVPISVASTDMSAGSSVSAMSFTTKQVRLDTTLRTALVTPGDVAAYSGAILLVPVKAGEPIPKAALAKRATLDGRRSVSMPIAPERAVGGKLRNGDRVDVYTTGSKGALIATDVEVLDVIRSDNGPLSAKNSLTVVLAVTNTQAAKIAPIVGSSDVVLVQSTGAADRTSTPTSPTTAALTPITSSAPAAAPQETPGG